MNGSLPMLESESDASTHDLVRNYVRAGSMPLWMQAPNGEDGTTTLDYQTDSLGSVVDLTDVSGDQACSYAYEPYGNPDMSADGNGISRATGVSPSVNPIQFGLALGGADIAATCAQDGIGEQCATTAGRVTTSTAAGYGTAETCAAVAAATIETGPGAIVAGGGCLAVGFLASWGVDSLW